jgi:hypothetical protein
LVVLAEIEARRLEDAALRYNRSTLIGKELSHFRITAELGSGAMGVVYRAEDTTLGRPPSILARFMCPLSQKAICRLS